MIALDRLRAYRIAGKPRVRVLVVSMGLACCAMEVESAVRLGLLVADGEPGEPGDAADAGGSTVLLVAGTVTDAMAPAVLAIARELPQGARIVSFGACAGTGGPYWDAPTVMKGVDQLVPVALYVPGCPPRPEALVTALAALADGST